MKNTHKFGTLFSRLVIALAITMFIPSFSQATSWTSSYDKRSKGSKGSKYRATGKVCGIVFEDSSDNAEFNRRTDKRLANVTVNVTDANGDVTTVTTNRRGLYCAKGIARGTATVDIDETTLPVGVEQVVGTDQNEVRVRAYRKNWAGVDGYALLSANGNVCGVVFVDVNKNKIQDYGEPGITNIAVSITDTNGQVRIIDTDSEGKYCASGIAEGEATVDVDENDVNMPADSEETTQSDPSTVNVIADSNNDAGADGYYHPNTGLGYVGTIVYKDNDKDGLFDHGVKDRRIPYIGITLIDSKGKTHALETDAVGELRAVLPLGEVTLTVDENDVDLPDNVILLEGASMTPITFENTVGLTKPTRYGFIKVSNP